MVIYFFKNSLTRDTITNSKTDLTLSNDYIQT